MYSSLSRLIVHMKLFKPLISLDEICFRGDTKNQFDYSKATYLLLPKKLPNEITIQKKKDITLQAAYTLFFLLKAYTLLLCIYFNVGNYLHVSYHLLISLNVVVIILCSRIMSNCQSFYINCFRPLRSF